MNYLANVVFPFTFFTSDRKTRGFLHAFLSGFYIQLGHYSREQKVANRFKRPVQKNREQLNNEPTWRYLSKSSSVFTADVTHELQWLFTTRSITSEYKAPIYSSNKTILVKPQRKS